MQYSVEENIEPFWAEYSSVAGGRDPLAIQNSSVVVYSKMLVGITNVTNRLRYIGFYCWIFDNILKNAKQSNDIKEQICLLRRAELLLAHIMQCNFEGITGISGTDYARRNNAAIIRLARGADGSEEHQERLYWKHPQGIFGQYYAGVVVDYGLINHPQPHLDVFVYTLTEKGEQLAISYSKNIPTEAAKLFLSSIVKGSISLSEIKNLNAFALHLIPVHTTEHLFYSKMLLDEDDRKIENTFHRRDTLTLCLKFLNDFNDDVDNFPIQFLRYNYFQNINRKDFKFDTSSAWYLYEANELIHVAVEHFHSCFQYIIDTTPTNINNSIDELLELASQSFQEMNVDANLTTVSKLLNTVGADIYEVYHYYEEMTSSFYDGNYGECLSNAVNVILKLNKDTLANSLTLKTAASLPEFNFNRPGYIIELDEDLVTPFLQLNIKDYLRKILLFVINRHIFSSYGKTKAGQNLVHNYLIEEDYAWRLRDTNPGRTSSRLQNAIQFLIDLQWVEKNDKLFRITEEGKKIIKA